MAEPIQNLTCGECGSVYTFVRNGRLRGPGAFYCQVCGQDIFIWVCDQNIDYDFKLVDKGTWLDPPAPRPA